MSGTNMPRRRVKFALLAVATAASALVGVSVAASAVAAPVAGCSTMTAPVYRATNPTTGAGLLTPWRSEYDSASTRHGFTEQSGVLFRSNLIAGQGLVAAHRLYHPGSGDFVFMTKQTEIAGAVTKFGYVDAGARFWVRATPGAGCEPVYRLVKGAVHRHAGGTEADSLEEAGWRRESITFYAAPASPTSPPVVTPPVVTPPVVTPPVVTPPVVTPVVTPPAESETSFTFAVLGDTQTWTGAQDTRFPDMTAWLVANRTTSDIQWVMQTGDFTNWGWVVPRQLDVGVAAMKKLQDAGLPFAISIGNHDTRAVGHDGIAGSRGYGGSAYVQNPECQERFSPEECKTPLLVRHTEEINARFSTDQFGSVAGVFEPGKIDNLFQTFEAGGKKWMVLSLELWPRVEAIEWANSVVAAHPDHNVVVQTHSFLEANGSIVQNNGGYGSTSGQYLYDNLLKLHPNITMVFSGHTGRAASRTDLGVNGNEIHSFLNNDVAGSGAAVRLVTVDTATGEVTSKLYDQRNDVWLTQYDVAKTITVR